MTKAIALSMALIPAYDRTIERNENLLSVFP